MWLLLRRRLSQQLAEMRSSSMKLAQEASLSQPCRMGQLLLLQRAQVPWHTCVPNAVPVNLARSNTSHYDPGHTRPWHFNS